MTVLSFADARAKKLAQELVDVQRRIEVVAREMMTGPPRPPREDIAMLVDKLGDVVRALRKIAFQVSSEELRTAAILTYNRYVTWDRAKLGSDAEREAAAAFLASIDQLQKVAR